MEKEKLTQILKDAEELGLLTHEAPVGEFEDSTTHVSEENLEKFIKFIATHPMVVLNTRKP